MLCTLSMNAYLPSELCLSGHLELIHDRKQHLTVELDNLFSKVACGRKGGMQVTMNNRNRMIINTTTIITLLIAPMHTHTHTHTHI